MVISKILSIFVAGSYLIAAFNTDGFASIFMTAIPLLVPLACIWWGDALGSYTGMTPRGYINNTTPGCFIALIGWVLLLLPLLRGFIVHLY